MMARALIEPENEKLSIQRQCELLGLPRSTYYHSPATESAENLKLMRLIDELYTARPFLGSRKMVAELAMHHGVSVNRKRIQRLMRLMGIASVLPRPGTSRPHPEHVIYPYLLRNLPIERPDHVWSADITYIPVINGWMYLVAVIDWYSRFVLAWELSNTMEITFCLDTLQAALAYGPPQIFNSDQGAQFTSEKFTGILKDRGIKISMDGKGRCLDNVWIERLWRSVKYEGVYLTSTKQRWKHGSNWRSIFATTTSSGRIRLSTTPRPRAHISATGGNSSCHIRIADLLSNQWGPRQWPR